MLPRRFELHRPDALSGALELLGEHDGDVAAYAGGTEILVALKARVLSYAHLVDLKRIAALRGISERADGTLIIGALTTHHELANHPLVRERLPAYSALSDNVANIRVRAAGTLGGNLCFAEPHADPPTMLCALDATLTLTAAGGQREIRMQDFIQDRFTTALANAELLSSVNIPAPPQGARAAYRAFGHLERPSAGVAAVACPVARGFQWRFWAGAVGARPVRLGLLEKAAYGLDAKDAVAAVRSHAPEEANVLDVDADLHGSADFKRHLVAVLACRAAEACLI